MGLYDSVRENLNTEFSFRAYCSATGKTGDEHKEARNQLKAMAKRGLIKRLSRNNFLKLK